MRPARRGPGAARAIPRCVSHVDPIHMGDTPGYRRGLPRYTNDTHARRRASRSLAEGLPVSEQHPNTAPQFQAGLQLYPAEKPPSELPDSVGLPVPSKSFASRLDPSFRHEQERATLAFANNVGLPKTGAPRHNGNLEAGKESLVLCDVNGAGPGVGI
jgi:hypothetical protein